MVQLTHFTLKVNEAQRGKGIYPRSLSKLAGGSRLPAQGSDPHIEANTTTRHLNQFQVETEEIHIWRSSSHHVEDFLIYISAWESWMCLYLPHFHGPLVNMASLDVTSLHSCPSFLHPSVLTGIENELQLFSISMEGTTFLILN